MGFKTPEEKAGLLIIGVNMDVLFDITSRQHTSHHVFKVLIITGFVQQALISLK